jgi:Carboxypeptidase regulatory-like domain/TonB-dependent Receptor Plug Domain
MKKLIFALMMVALSAVAIFAQTSRGVVSGTVTDPNGATVPGATVALTNTGTSVSRSAVTNGEGFFRFDAVDLGTYSVKISAANFGSLVRNNVSVSANQTTSVDAQLKLGSQEIVVDVVADTEQLQTEAAVRGGNIQAKEITELPIAGNPVALALTLPGVSSNRGGFGVGTFSVNGARGRSNNFLIDGTENNDISVAGQGFQITNQDAVQEVSVQTANYDSEFGRAGGAVVNVITKSGTNKFRGTLAFEYDSSADDAITAAQSRNPDVVKRGRPLSNTQFVPSATFGGPLFLPHFGEGGPYWHTERDKNFFFVAYENTRFRQPGGSVTLIVPTAAGRAKLQNFASNPNVAAYLAATATTIAPVANRATISLDNTSTGGTRGSVDNGEFFRSFSSTVNTKQFQLRTDHRLGANDQLSFRYLQETSLQPKGGTAGFEGFDADFASNYYNFLISETHVFSSTSTNELRIAYNRIDLGFPIADASGPAGRLPEISVGNGLTNLGVSATFPQGRIANNYQGQDTFTQILGNHTFRVGVDYLRQISTQTAPANIRGSLTYAAGGNFNALANFVDDLGGSNGTASRVFGSAVYNPTLHRVATFIQDRWKVANSLTLSYGIRYESFGTPFNSLRTPAFTGLFNVDAATREGAYRQPNKVKADKNNFAPSLGLAFSPSYSGGIGGFFFGENKSVIRAGYNIGFDSFFNNIASNAVASSPNTIVTTNTSALTVTNPRGLPNFSSQFPTVASVVLPTSAQTLIAPNLVNPYYQRWSLGFQRELPLKIFMDISYVGSKGTKLFINEDGNPLVRPELRSAVPAGYPVCTIGANLTTANQILPLFPAGTLCPITGRLDNIQGGRTVRTNGGSSSYNAAQTQISRRFGSNLFLSGSYTFSKLISNQDEVFGIGIGTNSSFAAIPFILGGDRNERAVSSFDRTHRASIVYVLQSPFFKSQEGFVGKLFGGFQVSGITTFESGVPYSVFNGFDSDGIGGNNDRPTYNPNGTPGVRAVPIVSATGAITGYFNPEIIVPVTPATPNGYAAIDPNTAQFIVNPTFSATLVDSRVRTGNLGRNSERSKGTNNFDMTILKRTKISEKVSFETRAEFFNVLNHPQFGAGASTANALTQGLFLKPINPTTSGGGRVVRYQIKLVF